MSHATSYNIFLKIIVSSITFNFFILYVIACLVHLEDIIALSIISKKQLILKRLRDLLLIHRLVHAQMATFNIFLFFCFDEMFWILILDIFNLSENSTFFSCGTIVLLGSTPPQGWGIDIWNRHTTLDTNPLAEGSARIRDNYLTTHNIPKRQTSIPPSGILTRNLSMRTAADPRLRPRGHLVCHPTLTRRKFQF